jgi:hypothetical protein
MRADPLAAAPAHSGTGRPSPENTTPQRRPGTGYSATIGASSDDGFRPAGRVLADIPQSPFRDELLRAHPQLRAKALAQFNALGIPIEDTASLHVSADGMLYYACSFGCGHAHHAHAGQPMETEVIAAATEPVTGSASIPVSNQPVYHSNPGAPYVIYLDFNGATISGTQWNANYTDGNPFTALPWSKDTDATTFNAQELAIIRRVWQRIAEDYAPFNVNVSTDPAYDPDVTGGNNSIGWILFTRDTDVNGSNLPAKGAGGVAFINVFGRGDYATRYQPAFVYSNNLGPNVEHFMAEAGSHEMGHNLGLSHDGSTGVEYYSGHGSGEIKWAPIMGSSYYEHVTTWSKGEYASANNLQDDLVIIAGKIDRRPDPIGDDFGSATELVRDGDELIAPQTRYFSGDEPNEGVIVDSDDLDMFVFDTRGGEVAIQVDPFIAEDTTYARGNNLDIRLTLYDDAQNPILVVDPELAVAAGFDTVLDAGTYHLAVEGTGAGEPMASPPTGYTEYGSLGMYFLSGYIEQPPQVVWHTPDGAVGNAQSTIRMGFSKPMDTGSFSLADIQSFVGPPGAIVPETFYWEGDSVLTLVFPEQSAEGAYSLVIGPQVLDTKGNPMDATCTAAFAIEETIEVATAESWRSEFFDPLESPEVTADDYDFDADGLVNLLERAFGSVPTDPADTYQPQQQLVSTETARHLALRYRQQAGGGGRIGIDYTVNGLTYVVEYTDNPNGAWQSGAVTLLNAGAPVDGMQDVMVQVDAPLQSGQRLFVRLRVDALE